MGKPFFTYILRCSDGSYYVGHTDELARRMAEHETGAGTGYTAARQPIQLVWHEEFPTREEAKAAEMQIKKWSRRKKEALIDGRMQDLKAAARKDWASYRQRKALRYGPSGLLRMNGLRKSDSPE
jgi:predicted GIY-YIG superfamily endonuclease